MAQTSAPSTCAWRVYLVYVERVCVKSHFFYALRDSLIEQTDAVCPDTRPPTDSTRPPESRPLSP